MANVVQLTSNFMKFGFKTIKYYRYIDILIVYREDKQIDVLLEKLNTINRNIKFTK